MASQVAAKDGSPVEPTPRKSFTPKQRLECLIAFKGRCAKCGEKIIGPFEINHIKPLFDEGPHELSNWEPVHKVCHKPITAKQAASRAKSDRLRIKNGPPEQRPPPTQKLKGRGFPKRWERT